ncbi:hypothetical protein LEP1GSC187_2781 [Leptospira santarosai str. ZUN179]|uniref:Uncharacterized protein n=1 Tax=Leptospira santarosai str. ZUN179 TaxID=1049985 RepID=M6UI17_9LEPT|nr:hypothetical protein LEP1GSC187_2781 [Leptospira santarosai str. ZUN179]
MFDINTVGILNYKNILELGIIYFHAFGVVIGVVLGFSKLFSNNFFNKSYGSVLQSCAFLLILNESILFNFKQRHPYRSRNSPK